MHKVANYHSLKDHVGGFICLCTLRSCLLCIIYINCYPLLKHAVRWGWFTFWQSFSGYASACLSLCWDLKIIFPFVIVRDTDLKTHTGIIDIATFLNAPPSFDKRSLLTTTLHPERLMYSNSGKKYKWLNSHYGRLSTSTVFQFSVSWFS